MFWVAAMSFMDGDAYRILYGVDAYGMTCGRVNTLDGTHTCAFVCLFFQSVPAGQLCL